MAVSDVLGNWEFNSNGSRGTLSITEQDAQGNLKLSVTFDDVSRIDAWTGSWNPGTRQLTLIRQLPGNVLQKHIGYIGDNDPAQLIFGGSFTQSDSGNYQAGWYAKYAGPGTIP